MIQSVDLSLALRQLSAPPAAWVQMRAPRDQALEMIERLALDCHDRMCRFSANDCPSCNCLDLGKLCAALKRHHIVQAVTTERKLAQQAFPKPPVCANMT